MIRVCIVRKMYEWIVCEESITVDFLSSFDFIEVIYFIGAKAPDFVA